MAALVNGQLKELTYTLKADAEIEFDLSTDDGQRIYVRSLSFLLIRAAQDLLPGERSVSNTPWGMVFTSSSVVPVPF